MQPNQYKSPGKWKKSEGFEGIQQYKARQEFFADEPIVAYPVQKVQAATCYCGGYCNDCVLALMGRFERQI